MGSYDVLLAHNAIRSAQCAADAVQNCKALLRTNGLLAVIEPTAKTEFFTLTIDMASGWWLHDDNADRLEGSSIISGYASHNHVHIYLSICRCCGVNMASQVQRYLQRLFSTLQITCGPINVSVNIHMGHAGMGGSSSWLIMGSRMS